MPYIEKRGGNFRVVFHLGGKRYRHTLKTKEERIAKSVVGGVERTIMLIEQRALRIPEDCDVGEFVLSGGQVKATAALPEAAKEISLGELRDRYVETMAIGAIEQNSLETVKMHLRHFLKTLGSGFMLQGMGLSDLQEHVNRRARAKGLRGRNLSPTTMRKEMASFRAAWNWGVQAGLVKGAFPNKGLKFPKLDEKPPFQTWAEIERRIEKGGLTKNQIADLWDCLYLRTEEIAELLESVEKHATAPWLYPVVAAAGHTGARRSELLRTEIADVDLSGNTILIHEKKRSREKRTTRRVPITPFLRRVLEEWLQVHPGGPWLFAQNIHVFRSKTKRSFATQVTHDECHDHFKRTLASGKWKVLRGIHSLRHSFISCLAAAGVDQRIIDELVGHQTPEQQKRYRHIFPSVKYEAVHRVFG